jgi:hypothetical protein
MDPLGFALENFDAVGQWRLRSEAQEPIDSSATLPDGTPVNGIAGLREVLLKPPYAQEFARTVISKMLTYALGRAGEPTDQPHIRAIMRDAASQNYSFESVIAGIVNSVPFQMRRAQPAAAAGAARR